MDKIYLKKSIAFALPLLMLTGCIDDNYDLSDIDTTTRIDVKDLVIPVNLDQITLKDMFSLDPDDPDATIQEINGEYAVRKGGTFESDIIHVESFSLASPHINPIEVPAPLVNGVFSIGPVSTEFSTNSYEVSSSIIDLERITTDFYFHIKHNVDLSGSQTVTLNKTQYQFPAGLTATCNHGSYESATGILTLDNNLDINQQIDLHVTAIELHKAGAIFDAATHSAHFDGEISLESEISISGASKPEKIDFTSAITMTDIPAKTITGVIEYSIDDFNVSDVTLGDLPDILADEETNIRIVNPQIYLSIHNPLQKEGCFVESGLTITALRNGIADGSFSPEPNLIKTGTDHANGIYNFCLAPKAATLEGYENATFVNFPQLSNVLAGDGIPSSLHITLDSPNFPAQKVTDFALGVDLGRATGDYTFFSPLALAAGSRVIYTDHVDGWGSEDLDKLVITTLEVNTTVNSDIPFDLNFTGYPIDINGNQIGNVEIEGAVLPANAQNYQLKIHITGEIHNLDGIHFVATGSVDADEGALRPDMFIKLTDIRPVVGGYYQTDF